ncbi:MAG: alpha amylase C-terminal domain-containing protein, partial [Pseudomonadota bacterium]|nr:alpha amylase C-terminal domain-containing protein [Pseudomonadota bacterium]
WNMGWMNDTLSYIHEDPIFRRYNHDKLTFSQLYAYSENFVLPLSHDEVVHGKGSLIQKMPGDDWQRFANLRLLFTFMMTFPGKKLNFMGNEFAQWEEWRATGSLDWDSSSYPPHSSIKQLICDLNHLYIKESSLYYYDFEQSGFTWVNCHDTDQSVISWLRHDNQGNSLLIVLNFTPVIRYDYMLGTNHPGTWEIIFNSDSRYYGGTNVGPPDIISAPSEISMGFTASIRLTLPPLGGLILKPTCQKEK